MRHGPGTSAAICLVLVWQGLAACADPPRVLFSDDFERHPAGAQLGTVKPAVSTEADLLRPLETRVSPFDVGTAAQLFVDRLVVRDSERIWFTQHPGRKHPQNPVLKPDQPWEGWRTEIFGNVLFDEQEQLFKMWYLPEPAGDGGYFDDPKPSSARTSSTGRSRCLRLESTCGTMPACWRGSSRCGRSSTARTTPG